MWLQWSEESFQEMQQYKGIRLQKNKSEGNYKTQVKQKEVNGTDPFLDCSSHRLPQTKRNKI